MRVIWIVLGFCLMFTSQTNARLNCDEALDTLKAGNKKFETLEYLRISTGHEERAALASAQYPFAAIVACSDSRLPPELVFNQSLGDLFVVRLAGNVVDNLAVATLEYGVQELGICLIVVLGHENCGAVKAAIQMERMGPAPKSHIGELVQKIWPAVRQAKAELPDSSEQELLNRTIQDNAKNVAQEIAKQSDVIRSALSEGRLKIVSAEYFISTGKVNWLDGS